VLTRDVPTPDSLPPTQSEEERISGFADSDDAVDLDTNLFTPSPGSSPEPTDEGLVIETDPPNGQVEEADGTGEFDDEEEASEDLAESASRAGSSWSEQGLHEDEDEEEEDEDTDEGESNCESDFEDGATKTSANPRATRYNTRQKEDHKKLKIIVRDEDRDKVVHFKYCAKFSLYYDVENFNAAVEKLTALYHGGKLEGIFMIGYPQQIDATSHTRGIPVLAFTDTRNPEDVLTRYGSNLVQQMRHRRQRTNGAHAPFIYCHSNIFKLKRDNTTYLVRIPYEDDQLAHRSEAFKRAVKKCKDAERKKPSESKPGTSKMNGTGTK